MFFLVFADHMSRVLGKMAFCIHAKTKPQISCAVTAQVDQRLCFRYIDTTIPLLYKSEIKSFKPSSVAVQPGLCQTWSQTAKTSFFITRLMSRVMR